MTAIPQRSMMSQILETNGSIEARMAPSSGMTFASVESFAPGTITSRSAKHSTPMGLVIPVAPGVFLGVAQLAPLLAAALLMVWLGQLVFRRLAESFEDFM